MRKIGATVFCGLAVVVLLAASAWACTNLATLNLSANAGQPSTTLNISGTAFATTGGSPVTLRWDSLGGPVLATTDPDPTGTIHTSVVIPADAQPGPHVIIATQDYTDNKGVTEPAYGTPARASFMVGAPPLDVAAPPAASPAVSAGAEGSSGGIIALAALLAVGGLGLFGAGLAVFARQAGRRAVPSPVKKEQ